MTPCRCSLPALGLVALLSLCPLPAPADDWGAVEIARRAFPGSANGSVTSIVAHTVFDGVILGCNYLIDLHTCSNLRTNYPQVRADEAGPPSESVSKVLVRSRWLRVPRGWGGIYLPRVGVGDAVAEGQLLATIADPVTDQVHEVRADIDGVVIGMSLPQVVLSGSALFHIGEVR